MAELFLQITVSLDGYIEGRDGDLSWFTEDTSYDDFITEVLHSIDGMIFGRKSHALLAEFWPDADKTPGASADLIEQTRMMNALPKYVLTHGKETTGWSNSHAIRADDIPRLKAEAKRPVALFAGAAAAQVGIERGLVDEVRLIRYPVLLGGGTPLFPAKGTRRELRPIGTQTFASGATLERYRALSP